MGFARIENQTVLNRECGNPDIIGWNGFPQQTERGEYGGKMVRCVFVGIKHLNAVGV